MALSLLESGRPADALGGFDQATKRDPGRPDYWAQYARCLDRLGRRAEALQCAQRAIAIGAADALTADTLGNVLARCGRHTEAVAQFEHAVAAAPDDARFRYNLAMELLFGGEFERAGAALERALELDPDHARAHVALAELDDGSPPAERIGRLEAALERAADPDRRVLLHHALARTLEAAGETALAFAHWTQGKGAKKAACGYTMEQDSAIFSAFESAFAAPGGGEPGGGEAGGEPSAAPIFVIGMPRSGTTLVERILASHSAVTSAGELSAFPVAVREAGGNPSGALIDTAAIAPALAADPARIGRRYLELARTVAGDADRFVDKLPLNFFFVGFIRRALPNAKIVCLRRGALDTCLASFRQLFAIDFPYYRYALSLEDTAEYIARFERLMAHWDRLYPGLVLHLQYERLVAEPEAESRRLLEHAGLDFEPAVLEFDRNREPVATASAVQVRRPITRGSVGAWRRYAGELEPVRRRLEALGVDPGSGPAPDPAA